MAGRPRKTSAKATQTLEQRLRALTALRQQGVAG